VQDKSGPIDTYRPPVRGSLNSRRLAGEYSPISISNTREDGPPESFDANLMHALHVYPLREICMSADVLKSFCVKSSP
jgi:hypothetical protein